MADPLKVLSETEKPWYQHGLRFACTECGQCCTGAPGYIWVSDEEISTIAKHVELSIEEFSQRYLRKVNGRFSLLEKPKSYDCTFLDGKKCRIYSVRPKQCRTFPWWPDHLESPKAWKEAARYCEGINDNAPLVSSEKIVEQLNLQMKTS